MIIMIIVIIIIINSAWFYFSAIEFYHCTDPPLPRANSFINLAKLNPTNLQHIPRCFYGSPPYVQSTWVPLRCFLLSLATLKIPTGGYLRENLKIIDD